MIDGCTDKISELSNKKKEIHNKFKIKKDEINKELNQKKKYHKE